mgnify:FL=1
MNKLAVGLSGFAADLQVFWILSVLASIFIIAASFILTIEHLDSGIISFLSVPHEHCLLCGMSHSIVLMSDWRFEEAFSWNAGGPFLYVILIANTLGGVYAASRNVILKNLKNHA